MYSPFKQYKIQPNLNNCSDIKGLRFVTKKYLLGIVVFTHKKHPRGANIHEIKELFPLKPSLVIFEFTIKIRNPDSNMAVKVNIAKIS